MRARRNWYPALLLAATIAVYFNSLPNPFVFDDVGTVVTNAQIRDLRNVARLFSPAPESPTAGRPLVDLSFALNYALGGPDVEGYHALNIALHAVCALLVFGIVRRTLDVLRYASPSGIRGEQLACAAALLWAVHPLNSEVVDYITQRTESLMALFYLLTMYTSIRAYQSRGARFWPTAAVLACAAGMACKESMATAPFMIVVYDRVFLFESFGAAVKSRGRLYAGLAAGYVVLIALMASQPRTSSAGFATASVSGSTYLWNQAVMVTRYLFLAVWPHALVLYYGWPRALRLQDVWPYVGLIGLLLAATVFVFLRRPRAGFPGIWFFVTLAPASSFVAVGSEVGAERRMYLPLVALMVVAVIAADRLLRRTGSPRTIAAILLAAAASVFSGLTVGRTREYQSPLTLAYTVLSRWPSPIAYHMVGTELAKSGRHADAIAYLRIAAPDYAVARYSLGTELFADGNASEAIDQLRAFVREEPNLVYATDAHFVMGRAFMARHEWGAAAEQFRLVLIRRPSDPDAHGLLAESLVQQQSFAEAVPHFRQFLGGHPNDPSACTGLGIALISTGAADEAIAAFRCAVDADPRNVHFRVNLARAMLEHGDATGAEQEAQAALQLDARDPDARAVLERARLLRSR